MDRISTASKAADLFGAGKHGFKDGNLSLGITPTDFNAQWFNGVQEELLNVIEAAGIVPSAATRNQLLTALRGNSLFQTAAQFNSDARAATTAFVQRALGNFQGILNVTTSPISLVAADVGKLINCYNAASSLTLPQASTLGVGSSFLIYSGNALTLNAFPGDTIVPYPGYIGTVTAVNIPASTVTRVTWNGGAWIVAIEGGGVSSVAATGYQRLPSGLIVQWGQVASSSSADVTVSFPIAFPNAVRFTGVQHMHGTTSSPYIGSVATYIPTGFSFSLYTTAGARTAQNTGWIAIGY